MTDQPGHLMRRKHFFFGGCIDLVYNCPLRSRSSKAGFVPFSLSCETLPESTTANADKQKCATSMVESCMGETTEVRTVPAAEADSLSRRTVLNSEA